MIHRSTGIALLLLGLLAGPAVAQEASCPAPANFPNPALLASLKRGVNLTGWDSADPARRPTSRQLHALRAHGFGHVRLPLDNRRLSGPDGAAYVDAIHEQAIWLLALDLAVVLDLHPDGTVGALFERDEAEAQAYLIDLWTPVARRMRFLDPGKVAIELLNEPGTAAARWRRAADALIPEVRAILPANTIVIGPAGPQRHEELAGMEPFADRNIVYAVHYYDPFAFTHQAMDWGRDGDPMRQLRELPFPSDARDPAMISRIAALRNAGHEEAADVLERSLEEPWTAETTGKAFDMLAGWASRHARPVVIGEFGVLTHAAPREARLAWLETVRQAAEARCIGWTHWDFQDGFGLIDPATGMPDAGVMDALAPG